MKALLPACAIVACLSSAAYSQSELDSILSQVTKVKGLKLVSSSTPQPPTDTACRAQLGYPCYSPQEMQNAYSVTPLLQAGYNGAGQTIVIIDSFGSPTIENDLKVFDAGYGLPDPPSFTVISPLGTVPFNPLSKAHVDWALETTLDVEWAHAMAPGAAIVLLTSPVNETQGIQGLPEFLSLEQYALDHHLGQIISQSWGTAENTLFTPAGLQVMNSFQTLYEKAAQQDVTVLASSGDTGTSNIETNGQPYSSPTVDFPASSPFVTAVGGTSLSADTSGTYQSEIVWNNSTGASGGGVSQQFGEPSFQNSLPASVQATLAGHRGIPDVAYNADPNTAVLVYASFYLDPKYHGYYAIGGTSEGAPQWAGMIADLNQLNGHPLGFLNPLLYTAAANSTQAFHDVTTGNNGFNGIQGYSAAAGWDFATGWGTPIVSGLVAQLSGQP